MRLVLTELVEDEVRPQLSAPATLVRYADDFVLIFARAMDAYVVEAALIRRLGAYGLQLHRGKTRLVHSWPRPQGKSKGSSGTDHRVESFDFLGFTFYWGRSRKGARVIWMRTARDRLARAIQRCWQWCRSHKHLPIREQHRRLNQALRGHDAYYGVTGNSLQLSRLRYHVSRCWFYWLGRRSQRRHLSWKKFHKMLERYPLQRPRIVHTVMPSAAKP